MPLHSLLRVIVTLSCAFLSYTGSILSSRSVVANGGDPLVPNQPEDIYYKKYGFVEGVTYCGSGHIHVDTESASPGTPAFLKHLVDEDLYKNNKGPWSNRYTPLHSHVVREACNIVFDNWAYASPNKTTDGNAYRPKYKNLIVFLPEDEDVAAMEATVEVVQGVMLSVMLSGTFDKDGQVVIISSIPRFDKDGTPLNYPPLRVFNIKTACSSLSEENSMINIVKFMMGQTMRKWRAGSFNDKVGNKILPLTLVQAWYQMAVQFSLNSQHEFTPNILSSVQNRYKETEGKPLGPEKVEHLKSETKSLYGMSEDSVLLIFGTNDAYAELLHKKAISVINPSGIERHDRKLLDYQIGVSDMNFSTLNQNDTYVDEPVLCSRLYFDGIQNYFHRAVTPASGDIFHIFDSFVKNYDGSGYISTQNPMIVKNCDKYPHARRVYDDGKQQCNLFMTSIAEFAATKCNGSTIANEHLAGLLSTIPPKKIIQIQLAPNLDNPIYEQISNVDSLSILQTMMGCPDLLPHINKDEYLSSPVFNKLDENPDSGVLSACTPLAYGIDNRDELRLRGHSFAQAYNNAENMKNNNQNFKSSSGCTNSVLTLYTSVDDRSMFYYPNVSKYFNTIIDMHLNQPCKADDKNEHKFEDISLWNHDCTYQPENATFTCDNLRIREGNSANYVKYMISISNGLYAWYEPVNCENFSRISEKSFNLPRMECILSNKSLLRRIDSLNTNIFLSEGDQLNVFIVEV